MSARFAVGDRVKIRRSWSELDGALGTIAEPSEDIRKQSGYGPAHFKEETTLTGGHTTIYWVEFGVSGDGEAAEFDETELEKL